MLRSAWVLGVGMLLTIWYLGKVYLLSIFGMREALCRSCAPAARAWSRAILSLARVEVTIEGAEHLDMDGASIVIANHESWFDVGALAGWLPFDIRFVG